MDGIGPRQARPQIDGQHISNNPVLVVSLGTKGNDHKHPLGQLGHGLGTDHAAIGDHAPPRDVKAPAITRISVVTSAVLPGRISEQTGRPSPSISPARIICRRSGRWSLL